MMKYVRQMGFNEFNGFTGIRGRNMFDMQVSKIYWAYL